MRKTLYRPGQCGHGIGGENVAIGVDDFEAQKDFVVKNVIDMVVVGPEDPLVKGVYDAFKADPRTKGVPVIGPSKASKPSSKAVRILQKGS